MSRTARLVLSVVGLLAVVVIGALAYIWVSAGSGEASGDISAPTLEAQFEDAVDAGTTAFCLKSCRKSRRFAS